VVSALLVINAVLGFCRSAGRRRRRNLAAALASQRARAARGNCRSFPPASGPPADILRVRPGDIIPADVKLLSGALSVDQSALTGESQDVTRRP